MSEPLTYTVCISFIYFRNSYKYIVTIHLYIMILMPFVSGYPAPQNKN